MKWYQKIISSISNFLKKINKFSLKKIAQFFYRGLIQWLNDDYEKPKQNISWTFIGFLTIPYFIFVGYTYITTYLEEFGVLSEEIDLTPQDCINILYKKGLLYFFAGNLYILFFLTLFFLLLLGIKQSIPYFNQKKKRVYVVLINNLIVKTLLFSIYLFLLYKTDLLLGEDCFILLFTFLLLSIFWNFFKVKYHILSIIASVFTFIAFELGKRDAQKMKDKKITFNITLKDSSQFLKEGDTSKYFIFKTNETIFIMNDNINKVEKLPISEIQKSSLTPKKN